MTKRVRYTIEGPVDSVADYRIEQRTPGSVRHLEWLNDRSDIQVTKEEIKTKGVVGPFDPDAEYGSASIAIYGDPYYVKLARLRSDGVWVEWAHDPEATRAPGDLYMMNARVVWVPKS